MKILVIGPSWIGDMVMTQSLFKLLKERHPDALIDVMAPQWSLPVLDRMPEVDDTSVMPVGHGQLHLKQRYVLGRQLQKNAYQQAILIPNSLKSALIPFWAKIPKRTGWLGEMRWGLLNDVRYLDKKCYVSSVQRFTALALDKDEVLPENWQKPCLQISSAALNDSLSTFNLKQDNGSILALCPGAEYGPSKRWPISHFSQLATEKIKQGWQVWLFGSAKDKPLADEIVQYQPACTNLVGKTNLGQAIDLLSIASAVVCNDSGLMHIAAALNRPLVALYGSTHPTKAPPLTEGAESLYLNLECSPCEKRECPLGHTQCLVDIKPAQVHEAIDRIIS